MIHHEDGMLERGRQQVRQAAKTVQDEALDEAFRRGIRRAAAERTPPARRLERKKRLRMAAAAAAVLLIGGGVLAGGYHYLPDLAPAAEQAQTSERIPAYAETMFDKTDNFLVMIKQAVDHGLYHEINRSAAAGGYSIQIHGAAADSRRIILFYTTENRNESLPLRLSYNQPPQLLDNQGRVLKGTFTWDTYAKLPKDEPYTKGIMIFDFESPGQMPESFQVKTTWSQLKPAGSTMPVQTETLVVPLTVPQSAHTADIEQKPLNINIEQNGHRITFNSMVQSPLRTDLQFGFHSDTGKELDQIEAVLQLASPAEIDQQSAKYDTTLRFDRRLMTPEGGILYLTSSFYSEHRELWLKFYYASLQPDHSVEIAVDPATGRLVSSPDDQISVEPVPEQSTDRDLRLRLLYGPQETVQGGYFELNNTFKDAEGQDHPFEQTYASGEGTYLRIPDYRKFPGPFRFEIHKYWGNVEELTEAEAQRVR